MQVGLLWFDNDPRHGLESKIAEAAHRYSVKFGQLPDTCYVNQKELNSQNRVVALAARSMRPYASCRHATFSRITFG